MRIHAGTAEFGPARAIRYARVGLINPSKPMNSFCDCPDSPMTSSVAVICDVENQTGICLDTELDTRCVVLL